MGTRCLTVFKDGKDEIAVMYRQMDGYPSCHGKKLAEFLQDIQIVNGLLVGRDDSEKVANGMECLAAQIIEHFKNGPGDIYLYKAGTRDCDEEYVYIVNGEINERPTIQACTIEYERERYKLKQFFRGTGKEFLEYIEMDKSD